MAQTPGPAQELISLVDLASRRLGGALAASDDFFAPKENLLKPESAVFIPGKFTDRGKWMDGWESRRKRTAGHDWCIIRLGLPGAIRGFTIDTAHFNGNQPEAATMDAIEAAGDAEALALPAAWTPILDRTSLGPSQAHVVHASASAVARRFTHLRLNIFPDGGVARLRVHGEVLPDWPSILRDGDDIDLAAIEHAGTVVAAGDMHFGSRHNLIMPGRAANMGDGWETRRRRGLTGSGGEHDWCIVRLGRRGVIRRIEVDTNHFKGNYPDRCMIECCDATAAVPPASVPWRELLPITKLRPSHRHFFDITASAPCSHARLNIYPDGGISRFRLHGKPLT